MLNHWLGNNALANQFSISEKMMQYQRTYSDKDTVIMQVTCIDNSVWGNEYLTINKVYNVVDIDNTRFVVKCNLGHYIHFSKTYFNKISK